MIEQLTGRKVLALLSQAHVEPDLTAEAAQPSTARSPICNRALSVAVVGADFN